MGSLCTSPHCTKRDARGCFSDGGAGPGASGSSAPQPRTIFQRAIEACRLTWRDAHLQLVLGEDCGYHEHRADSKHYDSQGLPLWHGESTAQFALLNSKSTLGLGVACSLDQTTHSTVHKQDLTFSRLCVLVLLQNTFRRRARASTRCGRTATCARRCVSPSSSCARSNTRSARSSTSIKSYSTKVRHTCSIVLTS